MKAVEAPDRPGPVRRWGPLAAVLGALALLAVLVVTTDAEPAGGPAETGATAAGAGEAGQSLPEGVMSFPVAREQGLVEEIDWGERCDTETGVLALPLSPPPECFAPYDGDTAGPRPEGSPTTRSRSSCTSPSRTTRSCRFIYCQIGMHRHQRGHHRDLPGVQRRSSSSTTRPTAGDVELIRYEATGAITDEVAATTDAETIARDIAPFMVFGGPALGEAFADTLAANEVMCISCVASTADGFYDRACAVRVGRSPTTPTRPGRWSPSTWATASPGGPRSTAGRRSRAGSGGSATSTCSTDPEAEAARERFEQQLGEYGVRLEDVASFTDPVSLAGQAREILARMKDLGVTTILYSGDPLAPQTLTETATAQDYFPEWVLTGSALVDTTIFGRTYDQEQWRARLRPVEPVRPGRSLRGRLGLPLPTGSAASRPRPGSRR